MVPSILQDVCAFLQALLRLLLQLQRGSCAKAKVKRNAVAAAYLQEELFLNGAVVLPHKEIKECVQQPAIIL